MTYQNSKWAVWLVLAIVVNISLLGLSALSNGPTEMPAVISGAVQEGEMMRGGREAKAVLVEYGDYQCPACALYEPIVKQLSKEFGDDLLVVYRHFPLRSIHKNADVAARAVEAAGTQGKQWQMHELLYEHQRDWSESMKARSMFSDYAQMLELNMAQFNADIDSAVSKAKVERDLEGGMMAQVAGTPTFFLNGKKIVNPKTYEQFRALIAAELNT